MHKNWKLSIALLLCLLGCDISHNYNRTNESNDLIYTKRAAGNAETILDKIYVLGGMNLTKNISEVGAFDRIAKAWFAKAPIITVRTLGGSAVLDEEIYLIGGRSENTILNAIERYSLKTNLWSKCNSMPTPRWSLMTCGCNGKIFAFGGISGIGNDRKALRIIESYDPISDTWKFEGEMPEALQGAAIISMGSDVIIFTGKIASWAEMKSTEHITNHVKCYNVLTKKWSDLTPIPDGRVGAKAILYKNKVFIVGGVNNKGNFPKDILVYDPKTNQWNNGPTLLIGRSSLLSAVLGDSLYIFGGLGTGNSGEIIIYENVEVLNVSDYSMDH